jgi:dihydrofolate reductase
VAGRIRVFIACSLDGFIAGEGDDLSWLMGPQSANPPPADGAPADDHGYDAFIAEVGALLIGRRTYDVVTGFDAWPYGERPVLVATTRALQPAVPSVRAVSGAIAHLLDEARAAAGGADVYLDGGDLIRQALDADLIDELVVSVLPVVLGAGHPLFAGVARRRFFELISHRVNAGGMVQLTLRPRTRT